MAHIGPIPVRVRSAWWLRWYLSGVRAMFLLTGMDPDWDQVRFWIQRAIAVQALPRK